MPRTPTMVNISGVKHSNLLMELFNQGVTVAPMLNDPDRTITVEYADKTLHNGNNAEVYPYVGLTRYVGWLLAKPIMIAFNPDDNIDVSWYNHYNGEGAAEAVIDALRATAEATTEPE